MGTAVTVQILRRGTLAVRESEARFRSVVESLGEGILIMNAADNILFLNQRTTELLGWRGEEILGRKVSEVMVSPERATEMALRNARRFQGLSEKYETVLRHRDSREIW